MEKRIIYQTHTITRIKCLIRVMVCVCVIIATPAWAQSRQYSTSRHVLEYSLSSLKQSASQVEERNKGLKVENDKFKQNIERTKQQLKMFKQRSNTLNAMPKKSEMRLEEGSDEIVLSNKTIQRMRKDLQELSKEEDKIQRKFDAKKSRGSSLKEAVEDIQSEIEELKRDIHITAAGIKGSDLFAEQHDFSQKIKQARANLQKLQKEHVGLQKKYAKSLKSMDIIQGENIRLQQVLSIRKDELDVAQEEEKIILAEIDNIENKQSKQLARLSEQIDHLKKRSQEFEHILVRVQGKLNKEGLDGDELTQIEIQLQENLRIIRRENTNLKQEMASLQKKMKKTQRQ